MNASDDILGDFPRVLELAEFTMARSSLVFVSSYACGDFWDFSHMSRGKLSFVGNTGGIFSFLNPKTWKLPSSTVPQSESMYVTLSAVCCTSCIGRGGRDDRNVMNLEESNKDGPT